MSSITEDVIQMYRIKADKSSCEGYANCVVAAPDIFDLDDEGVVVVLQSDILEDRRAYAENAVRSCPVAALRIDRVQE